MLRNLAQIRSELKSLEEVQIFCASAARNVNIPFISCNKNIIRFRSLARFDNKHLFALSEK